MRGIIYKIATGEIMSIIDAPEDWIQLTVSEEESFLETNLVHQNLYYVVDDTTTLKPVQNTVLSALELTANGTDSVTIINAPIGASCKIIDSATEVLIVEGLIDGTDSFSTDDPGIYKIKIELFPYLPWEGVINAI